MEDFDSYNGLDEGMFAFMGAFMLIYFVIFLVVIISLWKIFEKAGKPGWAAIIPIYNIIVLLEIIGKPIWWIILLIIPVINIFVFFYVAHLLSKSFGKDVVMTILLFFLPFIGYPMLAFSDARYGGAPQD